MNLAGLSIRNKTTSWVLTVLTVALGIVAYFDLPRLEDPEFTIKEALVITPYPGASAQEVEEEVSNVIELAVQQMGQLDRVVSRSERGRSIVTVTIKDQYHTTELPQVWDELRRKVGDARRRLRPAPASRWCWTTLATCTASSTPSPARVIRTPSSTRWPRTCATSSCWCRT